MAYWRLLTGPATPDGPLTGRYADGDLKLRLRCITDMLLKGETAVREAQRLLDADIASAKRNGQQEIANEALQDLADRRAR